MRGGARIHDLTTEGMLNYGLALLRGSGGVKVQDLDDNIKRRTDRRRRTWGPRALRDVDSRHEGWILIPKKVIIWELKGGLPRSFGVGAEVCSALFPAFRIKQWQRLSLTFLDHVLNLPITFPKRLNWLRLGHGLAHQQSLGEQGVCRRKLGAKLKGITIPRLVMITTCLMRQDLCCQCNWPRWSILFSFVPKAFYVLQCCKESKSTSTVCPVVNAGLIGWVQHPIGVLLNLGRLKQAIQSLHVEDGQASVGHIREYLLNLLHKPFFLNALLFDMEHSTCLYACHVYRYCRELRDSISCVQLFLALSWL